MSGERQFEDLSGDQLLREVRAQIDFDSREVVPQVVLFPPVGGSFVPIPGKPAVELLLRADRPSELVLEGPRDLVAETFAVVLEGRPSLAEAEIDRLDGLAGTANRAAGLAWARRVSVSIGDDTPLQVLPPVLGPDVSATTRELAAAFNAAWAAAAEASSGEGPVRVAIRLLSIEHGRVRVTAAGRWSRIQSGVRTAGAAGAFEPEAVLRLASGRPAPIEVRAFSGAAGKVELELTAKLEPGVRQRLMSSSSARRFTARGVFEPEAVLLLASGRPAPIEMRALSGAAGGVELDSSARLEPDVRQPLTSSSSARRFFTVRVDDQLQVSQVFRLTPAGAEPGPARDLSAVWVCVPRMPPAPAILAVAISAQAGSEVRSLGSYQVEVPSDASALVPDEQIAGYWFRAAAPSPIRLDGAAAVSTLRLELSSRGGGLELVHLPGSAAASGSRGMGPADFRRLAGGPAWLPRRFQDQPAQVLCDVELLAQPEDLKKLLYAGAAAVPLPGLRFSDHRVVVPPSSGVQVQDFRRLVLRSEVSGELRVRARTVFSTGPPKVAAGKPVFATSELLTAEAVTDQVLDVATSSL